MKMGRDAAAGCEQEQFSPGLRTCRANRKNVIQECENPIAEGDFKWIFAIMVQQG